MFYFGFDPGLEAYLSQKPTADPSAPQPLVIGAALFTAVFVAALALGALT